MIVLLIGEYLIVGFYLMKRHRDKKVWRKKAIEFVSRQSQRMLRTTAFDVSYKASHPDLFSHKKKYFMVCNHMSYMDILFLSADEPAVFVTSFEMKEAPFLGHCAEFGGSYFVERRKRHKIPHEIKDLAQLLRDGFHVFVFPEATSHNGMSLLPFKKSMFSAAIEAGTEVLPICLRYEKMNGEDFSEKNNDNICWYGGMRFLPHFFKMMKLRSAKITVEYLEPISSQEYPDRALLAEKAFAQIHKAYFADRPSEFLQNSSKENSPKNKGEKQL